MAEDLTKFEETEYVEGFAISGEFIKNLGDKHFEIIEKPIYEIGPDLDRPGETKRKLVLNIKLFNGQKVRYYPNKKSQRVIIDRKGFALKDWIGFEAEFFTVPEEVREKIKEVIYIK